MTPTDQLNAKLNAYRMEQAARRARAFIDCPEIVLGTHCRPVTPKTWSMLHAMGNRFIAGGGEPGLGDVRTFIWIHSPLFTMSRLLQRPARWLALLRFNVQLMRNRDLDWGCSVVAMASLDIDRIIADVLADAPKGRGGRPASACLEAQLIHLFAEAYGWSDEKTAGTPLARLFQLRRNFAGAEDEDDAGERQIRYQHLVDRNTELRAQREAATPNPAR